MNAIQLIENNKKNYRINQLYIFFYPQKNCLTLQLYLKKTPAQLFSCEFCEIFKNTFLTEHLRWLLLNIILYFQTRQVYSYLITAYFLLKISLYEDYGNCKDLLFCRDWYWTSISIYAQQPLDENIWFCRKTDFIVILKLILNLYCQIASEATIERGFWKYLFISFNNIVRNSWKS